MRSDLTAHFCLEEEYELALKQAKTVYGKITAAPKIQPKRGDYMFVKSSDNRSEWIYIASGEESYPTGRICSYSTSSSLIRFNGGVGVVTLSIEELRYATSEEKKILDEALWDQGLIFNRSTLGVETIPKPGELCILWSGDVTHAIIGQVTEAFTKGIFGRNGKTYTDWAPFKSIPQYLDLVRDKDCGRNS